MKQKIEELINLLDVDDDWLLIGFLEIKIKDIEFNYKAIHEVTDQEVSLVRGGFKRTVRSWVEEDCRNNIKHKKIDKIINRVPLCEDCKYKGSDGYGQIGHPVCISCGKRVRKLKDLQEKIYNEEEKKYTTEIPVEILKAKALMNKINNKLRILKQNNYETC